MEFCIKVEKESEYKIMIESPAELGDQVLALLTAEGYAGIQYDPEAIGKSTNNVFDLEEPEIKKYSFMTLAQKKETDSSDIAKCIHANFGGYLSLHGENFVISSEINDFATL